MSRPGSPHRPHSTCPGNGEGVPRPSPVHGRMPVAERDVVGLGGFEADAPDVTREPIRVLGHDLDGLDAVGLEYPHCPRCTDAVGVQEEHDLPYCLLLGPGGSNSAGTHGADAVDPTQTVRLGLDHAKDLLSECANKLLGVDRPNSPDPAGG